MAKGIQLNWTLSADDATDVDHYSIKQAASAGPTVEVAQVAQGVNTYTTGALADGTYYFRITAVDADGNGSPYSNEVSETVDTDAPAAPTALTSQVVDV